MDEAWKKKSRVPISRSVTCCYHCPVKWVSEEYNCHSHCELYAAECWEAEKARKEKATTGMLIAQRGDAVHKAKKHMRRHTGHYC